ncbi:2OG-Fe(II) oxygenase [Tellurirhabdus bombi]|uniref:2OG-Fe(II) oxygenase n=1 Tax=Tellurirhabdus bombi TaxID=2907205 RepID=UPI001F34E176|nr:2OG-Fe(II) oxygenase [Tellurirhabdus bombi]
MEERFELLIDGILEKGYGIVDDFLSPDEVEILRQTLYARNQQGEFKTAAIGNQQVTVQTSIRGDQIRWLDRADALPEETLYLDRVQYLIEYLNRTCYLGLLDSEIHYALYPAGTFYKRHLDRFRANSSLGGPQRKLSVICYLNQDWQESDGGQLVVYLPQPDGGEEAISILPAGGRLVCFESDKLEHEVLPATRERLSLTGWLRTGGTR